MSKRQERKAGRENLSYSLTHGASHLPMVEVNSYNLEITDEDGWIGDQASRTAFWEIIAQWRKPLKKLGTDPFADMNTFDISKQQFDALLFSDDSRTVSVAHSIIEDFAQKLASVIARFLKVKKWEKTRHIAVGGGLKEGRAGQIAVHRTELILLERGIPVTLELIANGADEAGLMGAAYLVPYWMLKGFDGMLAVDIGGTNIRAGVLTTKLDQKTQLARPKVWKSKLWRHADDEPNREGTVTEIVQMLSQLAAQAAKAGLKLSPIVGIGVPGMIAGDGSIKRGAQNLPGNWESSRFNLGEVVKTGLGSINGHEPIVVIHNDAVIQGLSELPRYLDVKHWAVITIGTGLGNAKFSNIVRSEQQKAASS